MKHPHRRFVVATLTAASILAAAGCAPLVIGGAAAGTALVATDRRSSGIQLEDQAIELRVRSALDAKLPSKVANVRINSFNQRVLLTGEVATEEAKAEAQAIAEKSPNVHSVRNEIYVGALSTFANRNYDRSLAAKVTIALIEAPGVPSGTISVVSSRSIVYLMGLVTEAEGDAAARAAARVSGVRQVVKYFDYISEKDAAALTAAPAADSPPK
jgi:osmotically-inducible protein OsmY